MVLVDLFSGKRGACGAGTGRANRDGAGTTGTGTTGNGTNQAVIDGNSGIREKNDHRCFGNCRGGWTASFVSGG